MHKFDFKRTIKELKDQSGVTDDSQLEGEEEEEETHEMTVE